MNFLDIIIILLLITGLIRGFLKGFIFEVAVLGAMFLGFYAGFRFAGNIEPWVVKTFSSSPIVTHYVSFFLIFLVVSTGIFFLAKLFEGLVNIAALGLFNKIAGAIFGILKYLFVISLALYFFNAMDATYGWIKPDTKADSKLYYKVLHLAPTVLPVLDTLRSRVSA